MAVLVAALDVERECRVLAVRRGGQWRWHPESHYLLRRGDRVAVAATRAGLSRLTKTFSA